MALKFIDLDVGLPHLWSKIKALMANNTPTIVTATSSDGVTYTATLNGVTTLKNGLTITIVPSVVSTSISAKLNLNNLGAKYIRQSTTNNTATALTPKNANWMAANKPITIQYDGTQWKTIAARSNVSDMNGVLAVANGGTGATTKAAAQTNLGLNDAIVGLSVSGKTITYTQADGGTGTITTQDTNTTYSNMTAATASAAGKAGLVPAPAAGKQASFLRGDGTWAAPASTAFVPNYSAGVAQSIGTSYTATENGTLVYSAIDAEDDIYYTLEITYNGVTNSFKFGSYSDKYDTTFSTISFAIPKGATYKITQSRTGGYSYNMKFFPWIAV